MNWHKRLSWDQMWRSHRLTLSMCPLVWLGPTDVCAQEVGFPAFDRKRHTFHLCARLDGSVKRSQFRCTLRNTGRYVEYSKLALFQGLPTYVLLLGLLQMFVLPRGCQQTSRHSQLECCDLPRILERPLCSVNDAGRFR